MTSLSLISWIKTVKTLWWD